MSTIIYAVSGEGRGHATRAKTIVDYLAKQHEIIIFAPPMPFEILSPPYKDSNVKVVKIPGLNFKYDNKQQLDLLKSATGIYKYRLILDAVFKKIDAIIKNRSINFVISDFEPLLSRYARKNCIPFIVISHQHFLRTCKLNIQSLEHQLHAMLLSFLIPFLVRGQEKTILSSFFHLELKPKYKGKINQVGILVRDEVLNTQSSDNNHIVVYQRRFTSKHIIDTLIDSGKEVHVYGIGKRPSYKNVHFFDIHYNRFIEDLASGSFLVSTAGNQLVGEALYLNKPVLAIPEPGNYEQAINGYFLEQMGVGKSVRWQLFSRDILHNFEKSIESYKQNIDRKSICGNQAVEILMNEYINKSPSDNIKCL